MKKKYIIYGYRPAISKEHNDFISKLDLGIDGAFVFFSEIATVTFEENISQEKIDVASENIKDAYKKYGCVNVSIIGINNGE